MPGRITRPFTACCPRSCRNSCSRQSIIHPRPSRARLLLLRHQSHECALPVRCHYQQLLVLLVVVVVVVVVVLVAPFSSHHTEPTTSARRLQFGAPAAPKPSTDTLANEATSAPPNDLVVPAVSVTGAPDTPHSLGDADTTPRAGGVSSMTAAPPSMPPPSLSSTAASSPAPKHSYTLSYGLQSPQPGLMSPFRSPRTSRNAKENSLELIFRKVCRCRCTIGPVPPLNASRVGRGTCCPTSARAVCRLADSISIVRANLECLVERHHLLHRHSA